MLISRCGAQADAGKAGNVTAQEQFTMIQAAPAADRFEQAPVQPRDVHIHSLHCYVSLWVPMMLSALDNISLTQPMT